MSLVPECISIVVYFPSFSVILSCDQLRSKYYVIFDAERVLLCVELVLYEQSCLATRYAFVCAGMSYFVVLYLLDPVCCLCFCFVLLSFYQSTTIGNILRCFAAAHRAVLNVE